MKQEITNPLKKQEEEMDRILFTYDTPTHEYLNEPYFKFKETKTILLQLMKELKLKNNYLTA